MYIFLVNKLLISFIEFSILTTVKAKKKDAHCFGVVENTDLLFRIFQTNNGMGKIELRKKMVRIQELKSLKGPPNSLILNISRCEMGNISIKLRT